jgi:hypothetical protein
LRKEVRAMSEVRTHNGKLVGTVDTRTSTLHIRDGKKTTMIEIPESGLKIRFVPAIGAAEDVYIPPLRQTTA